jgi:hypothetical protein
MHLEPLGELKGDQARFAPLDERNDLGDMKIDHRDEKKRI